MITLITGIPGMGKTSLLVSMLLEYEKAAERPLFVMGIPDLKLEHIVAPPVKEWTEYRQSPEDPNLSMAYFTFPPNSILIIDEAQRVFRPRASASKVPPEVAALETHRHTGLDIILLTQKPKLIDTNVRELIGKHIHIRAGMVGRHLYEWPHIADGESRLDRGDAAKRRFSPPKESFKNYKSAEVHTKHKFRIHQGFFFLAIAVVFFAYQAKGAYDILDRNSFAADAARVTGTGTRSGAVPGPVNSVSPSTTLQPGAIPDNLPPLPQLHPFVDGKFTILGDLTSSHKRIFYLEISLPDSAKVPVTSIELIDAGYTFIPVSPCLALVKFGTFETSAFCRKVPPVNFQQPSPLSLVKPDET